MIATILQREPQTTRECVAAWRQLGDILAQRGMQLSGEEIHRSLRALAALRSKVPEHIRRDSALSVARHGRFAPLVALYANDVVPVAAAMLQNAVLPDEDWLALLPATNDVARSILAGRSDLPLDVKRALESLGAGAVSLPAAAEACNGAAEHIAEPNGESPDVSEAADTAEPLEMARFDWTQPEAFEPADELSTEKLPSDERPGDERPSDERAGEKLAAKTQPETPEGPDERTSLRRGDDEPDHHVGPPTRPVPPVHQPHVSAPAEQPLSQISELVRRIDKFQAARTVAPRPPKAEDMSAIEAEILAELKGSASPVRAPKANLLQFRFETMADGVICWAEGVAPQAIIGLSIADAALGTEPGTDGVAAGAFRQRAEIDNARMRLGGSAEFSGEWRIAAEPLFDQSTGQFRGYRGIARRPLRREKPYGQPVETESGDSIRQLIHELRSPLNAISGFAQIISGQMFGPVSAGYRTLADTIIQDAEAVQAIIEDLDAATGLERHAPVPVETSDVVDLVDVFSFVSKDLQALLAEQRVGLSITEEGGPFMARADISNVRRMVGRLLTALIDVSEPDSLLVAQLIADLTRDDMVQLRIVRPAAIRFASAQQLLDPGYSPDGDAPGADILSLGFSLRLVGSLAIANQGRLEIAQNALILHLPLATSRGRNPKNVHKND